MGWDGTQMAQLSFPCQGSAKSLCGKGWLTRPPGSQGETRLGMATAQGEEAREGRKDLTSGAGRGNVEEVTGQAGRMTAS